MKRSTLSLVIRDLRLKSHLSQFELAEKVGTSYSYISRLEASNVDPRWSTIEKIFRVFDTAIFVDGYLFNLIDKKQ